MTTEKKSEKSEERWLESSFVVQCTGQIDSGRFEDHDFLYLRYAFCQGSDWQISAGLDNGLSQTACRNNLRPDSNIVWNFPIDITYKSTNIHGWPRMAISVYGIDFLGRDVIRGYGSLLVPLTPGIHKIQVDMFTPKAGSTLNDFLTWITGNPPEFFDSRFVCQGEGREVSRVITTGTVNVTLQIVIKGMEKFGYSV